MEEKKIIDQFRTNFSAILYSENLKDVYKINSYNLNLISKLRLVNEALANKLQSLATNISSSSNLEEIHILAEKAINELKEKKKERYFIIGENIIKTKEYKAAIDKYAAWKEQISETEDAILSAKERVRNLHDEIARGKYKDCWHARITENLRIMYYVSDDRKILAYIDIITKNGLDNSFRIRPINWKEKFTNI